MDPLAELRNAPITAEERDKCFRVSSEYLDGVWRQIQPAQLMIRRIVSGFMNRIYMCGLPDDLLVTGNEPREVLVRFFIEGKAFGDKEDKEKLSDFITSLVAAEEGLGPKIFGVYPGGRIEEFIPSRTVRYEDYSNPELTKQIASKMARFHCMDVPIKKTMWIGKDFDGGLAVVQQWLQDDPQKCREQMAAVDATIILDTNLSEEVEWLKQRMAESKSPIMFGHQDFRQDNMLIRLKPEPNGDQIVLIDYEYSSYAYRGYDFGYYFGMWCLFRDQNNPFDFRIQDYPSGEQMRVFLGHYLNELVSIKGPQDVTVEHLIREAKLFTLVAKMFMVMVPLQMQEHKLLTRETLMALAANALKAYFQHKAEFKAEGIF